MGNDIVSAQPRMALDPRAGANAARAAAATANREGRRGWSFTPNPHGPKSRFVLRADREGGVAVSPGSVSAVRGLNSGGVHCQHIAPEQRPSDQGTRCRQL